MRIALGSDHAGYALKTALKDFLSGRYQLLDFGTDSEESVDYPDFAKKVGEAISGGAVDRGILICGSGIGISIAANRFRAVRCALCVTEEMAKLSRQHNDANVLALGSRLIDLPTAQAITDTFLATGFEGGRHEARVRKLG